MTDLMTSEVATIVIMTRTILQLAILAGGAILAVLVAALIVSLFGGIKP